MRLKIAAVTLGIGLPAAALSQTIWPNPPGIAMPPEPILGFYIALSVAEALLFGLGIAFLAFGLPLVRRARVSPGLNWATYLSIAWLLVNWWPHDNFHRANGFDLAGLVRIEYGFHATLYLAGLVVAWFFISMLRREAPADQDLVKTVQAFRASA
ncbi:MAG TPA: hypothetical protein VHO95_13765 [Candidatus Dormibacteraeota bacterium]|nr:hypothetical protein [Candidatus Dormibacteraeota bacterium]